MVKRITTSVNNAEIAGFSEVKILHPKPSDPEGLPSRVVMFALNVKNERLGYAWLPLSQYESNPKDAVARIKDTLYKTISWMRQK